MTAFVTQGPGSIYVDPSAIRSPTTARARRGEVGVQGGEPQFEEYDAEQWFRVVAIGHADRLRLKVPRDFQERHSRAH